MENQAGYGAESNEGKYCQPLDLGQAPIKFEDDMPVASPELMRAVMIKGRRRSGVPERYLMTGFDDIQGQSPEQAHRYGIVKQYGRNFKARDYPGMIICGKVGTGKTMCACALTSFLSDSGHDVFFTNLSSVFDRVRSTYAPGGFETRANVIDDYTDYDLLVIDELGVHHGTLDEKNIISRIVDGRYNKMKPTVLVGNLNQDEMVDYAGEHVIDRVLAGRGPFLVFDWGSMRGGLKR